MPKAIALAIFVGGWFAFAVAALSYERRERERDAAARLRSKLALATSTLRVYAEANGSPPGKLAAETIRKIEEG